MVRSKRSSVFPLRISNPIAFADRDPSIFASGNTRPLVCLLKPRNNARRFRPVTSMCFVIVRERAIKRVLPGCKFYRNIMTSMGRVRVIKTAVAFVPFFVPRAGPIWDEIMSTWLFADPKDCRHDICFPRIQPNTRRDGRFFDDGLVFSSYRFALCRKGRISCD